MKKDGKSEFLLNKDEKFCEGLCLFLWEEWYTTTLLRGKGERITCFIGLGISSNSVLAILRTNRVLIVDHIFDVIWNEPFSGHFSCKKSTSLFANFSGKKLPSDCGFINSFFWWRTKSECEGFASFASKPIRSMRTLFGFSSSLQYPKSWIISRFPFKISGRDWTDWKDRIELPSGIRAGGPGDECLPLKCDNIKKLPVRARNLCPTFGQPRAAPDTTFPSSPPVWTPRDQSDALLWVSKFLVVFPLLLALLMSGCSLNTNSVEHWRNRKSHSHQRHSFENSVVKQRTNMLGLLYIPGRFVLAHDIN